MIKLAQSEALELKLKSTMDSVNKYVQQLNANLKVTESRLTSNKTAINAINGSMQTIKTFTSKINDGSIVKSIEKIDNKTGKVVKETTSWAAASERVGKATKSVFTLGRMYAFWNQTKIIRDGFANIVKSAVDYNETVNKFNVSMGTAVNQATQFQNKLSEAIGSSKTELMDYQSTFNNVLKSMGDFTDEVSEKISESLVKMGLDYSSLFNVNQNTAMQKFQSALTGSIKPIRSDSGYDVSDTTIGAKAKSLGIERSTRSLTQMEKRILRIIVLMDQMKNTGAFNDLARTIEEPANQIKVLKNQLQELRVALGNMFMGMLTNVLPVINGAIMTIIALIKTLTGLFGGTQSGKVTEAFTVADEATGGISKNLGSASKKAKELKKILMGFDVLNVINTPSKTDGGSSGGAGDIGSIDPKILKALSDYDSQLEKVRMKATDIRDRIMEWLGFTQVIDPLTGEISWKLKEGYQNIEKIRDAAIALGATIAGVKVLKGLASIKQAFTILGGTKLITWFKNLGVAIKGTAAGSSAASSALTFMLNPLIKTSKILGGAYLTIKGTNTVTGEYNKLLEHQAGNQWKVAGGMASMAAGGALIGSIFPGIGTAIGGVAGALVGLIVNVVKSKEVIHQLAEEELWGTLSISTNSWTQSLNNLIDLNVGGVVDNWQSKISTLSNSFQTASAEVEGYGIRFGVLGEKISNEDAVKIENAVKNMCESSTQMIDENTSAQLQLWTNTYETLGTISEKEQQDWLQVIQDYGSSQKKELKTAQDNITNTYNKAIKTRGYLTDEEYKYIQQQLKKVRELTKKNMSQSNSDVLYLKDSFVKDSSKLDEQSYRNYNEAAEKFRIEKFDAISKEYNTQLNMLNQMLESGKINTEKYNNQIGKLNAARAEQEVTVDNELKKYKQEIFNSLMENYNELVKKTDKSSKEQVKILNQLFKDVNVDPENFVTQMKSAGRKGNEELLKAAKSQKLSATDLLGSNQDWANKGSSLSNSFWTNFRSGKISINTNDNGTSSLRVQPYKSSMRANGGPVSVGEMFIAREAGPELVGKIGNTTTVMNNDQIVSSVSRGVAQAVSGVLGNGFGTGDIRLIVDGRELSTIVANRQNRNNNIYGMA